MNKILLLSTGDVNGAYEAVYRIASYLREDGYEVALAVRFKSRSDKFIYQVDYQPPSLAKRITGKISRMFFSKKTDKDLQYLFLDEDEQIHYTDTDRILEKIPFVPELVLAGMTDRFTNTRNLLEIKERTGADIYLLTVDMFPITGGCHFAWNCKGYETDCSDCPAAKDSAGKILVHKNFITKQKNITTADIKILAGSGWTLMQAKKAALFKHQDTIYNISGCVDTRIFTNKHRTIAKGLFGIDDNLKLVFCGSQSIHDTRKGFSYFLESLNILHTQLTSEQHDKVCILIVGSYPNPEVLAQIPFKTHIIDFIKDYRLLALAYQASDIFVCASIEDSGPLMVSEALASGTPVVGFEMGIVYDMVITGFNGYKAELKNSADMAKGLKTILTLSPEEYNTYSANAVKQVEEHASYKTVLEVFKQLQKSVRN